MDGQLVSQTQPDELNHLLDQAPAFKDFGLPESVHDVPSLIEYLEDQHLWTYDRLCALRQCSTATSLALADDSSLLDGLARHDARDWNQLVYLELHDMQITEDQMDLIARLPLNTLAICNSGLTMTHLARLLPLGGSLQALDISGNPGIDDTAIPALAFLSFLTALDCYDTSVSMNGLRSFARVAEPLRRFPRVQITPPQPCRDYLVQAVQSRFYAFDIQDPFIIVSEPDKVDQLSEQRVWENIKFHQRARRKAAQDAGESDVQLDMPEDVFEAKKELKQMLLQRQGDLMVLNHCPIEQNDSDQEPKQRQIAEAEHAEEP